MVSPDAAFFPSFPASLGESFDFQAVPSSITMTGIECGLLGRYTPQTAFPSSLKLGSSSYIERDRQRKKEAADFVFISDKRK